MIKITEKITKEFKNKTILVTGGTGSIGTALVKKLMTYKPKTIRILTNDENSIYEMKKLLKKNNLITYMLGDVRDKDRINLAIRGVDIVFHTAAMKHIDICEQNPFDAVKTNVIGTSNLLEAALIENISKFIFISTDKTANPSTTLGASKLLAERLTLNANSYRGKGKTVFSIVRFGNVIGSRGSVFHIFSRQIKNNEPITITDKNMTRFMMSISDAVLLILKVVIIARDNEIYILKMPSIRIENLAKIMLDVFKQTNSKKSKSKIIISQTREHEKLNELLITENELMYCQDVGDMYKITDKINKKPLEYRNFNSDTAKEIPQKNLKKIILELLNKQDEL